MHSPAPSRPQEEEQFLREVRNGLHALAQPLTLLQIRLEAALLCGSDAFSGEPLLSTLGGDVQRACEHFAEVQELIRTRGSVRLEHARFCAQDALRSVHETLSPRFEKQGVTLRYTAPIEKIWVLANEHDLRCSLLQAILLLSSILSASDAVELSLQTAGPFALVEVVAPEWGRSNSGLPPMIAEAITRSFGTLGFAVVQDLHFKATMRLPLAVVSRAKASQ